MTNFITSPTTSTTRITQSASDPRQIFRSSDSSKLAIQYDQFSYIIKWMAITANVPASKPRDELDTILDKMTDDERLVLVMSLAGSRPDLEEDTDDDWGFIDWDSSDDLST